MKKVIAGIDNSAASRPVLAVAGALAPVLGATAEAVHIADGDGITARAAADAVEVPLHVLSGDPVERLAEVANDADTVALVLGSRNLPKARRPVGHVALEVCRRTDKPVVLVAPHAKAAEQLERVVVAVEGTPGHARRLQRAVDLVDAADLEMIIVHVDDESTIPSFSDQVQHETEAYAQEFLARHARGARRVRFEPRIGVPAEEILAAADSEGAQLIAIGRPRSDAPGRGAVAHEILRRSRVPVLMVATVE